ncbi:MAG: tetratricopeptide repeat protein [Planctomycetia bacterium]|nr:tetratricopeptide repeat protein [Planctomycetia bacterium]
MKSNNSAAFRAQYAQFLVRQKQYDEALALTFEKADGTDPARDALAVIRILTAVASQGEGQPSRGAAAEKFATDIGASQPGNVPLLLELGVLRLMQGRAPDALKLFESAQKRSPANPAVLNNLALAQLESPDRRHEALATIDKALAFAPQSAELLDSKALILIGAGRYQEAREILDQLCRTQTRNPRLRLHLAIALFQLRDEPGSRSNAAQATDDGLEKELLTPSERRLWRQIANQVAGVTAK